MGSCQNGLKLLHPLPSPGKGPEVGLVEGWGVELFAWDWPVVLSKEPTSWTYTVGVASPDGARTEDKL